LVLAAIISAAHAVGRLKAAIDGCDEAAP